MYEKVSIILPVYKKEKYVKDFIQSVIDVMEKTRWDYELIVVVDGYLDKSVSEAKKVKSKKVSVYGYQTNKGKGYAVRYGMARATGRYIVFMDVSLKLNPKGIILVLEHMDWYDADVIVASKRHPASKVEYAKMRRVFSFGYQILNFILFRLRIRDTQVGMKAFRREVLEKVLPRLIVKQYAFDIELLAVSRYLGFTKMYEAPVELDFKASESRITSEGGLLLLLNPFVRKMLVDTLAVFYRMYIIGYYHDKNKRKWRYDKELQMRVNTGE